MPTERTKSDPDGPCSVNDLLEIYEEMIVPHFQRGLVWEESSVSLLLESLYYETPCGSIILWTPVNASQQGRALGKKPKYLIVDGQQRIRSLWNVFREDADESINRNGEEDDGAVHMANGNLEENDEGNKIWCLNLGQVRELEKDFDGGKRFRLFRRANDPRKAGENVRGAPLKDREALLPLGWFLKHTDEEIAGCVEKEADVALQKAAKVVLENDIVKKRLRQILTFPRFHVSILDATYRLEDVVGIYNRINSAGKRVEAEERAFANLVSVYPEVNRTLREFFSEVHGGNASAYGKELSEEFTRDDLLERQKENRFGFKLFMRTLVQVLAYHSNRAVGASAFSFESVNADTMNDEGTREHLPEILDSTKDILVYLACVLREKLCCDDFRMLPETSSFWPIIQLIIRFPGLMEEGKGITASLAFRLLLANKQNRELLILVAGVNESQSLEEALGVFEKDSGLAKPKIEKAISAGFRNANSLMNRCTLIFYWFLRNRAARDFSYDINTSPEKADGLRKLYGGTEARLCEAVRAEKQHIVPYKRLKMIFNLEGKARPGQHEVHNIGNITYISHGENDFKTGIGSNPLKLDSEPSDNLEAHLLMDRQGNLLKAYNGACGTADPDDPKRDFGRAKKYFDKFSKIRRALITDAIILWADDIRRAGMLHGSTNEKPAKRLIIRKIEDEIRDLGYPPNVESVLITLCDMKGMVKSRKQGADVSCGFMRKLDKRRRLQLVRVDLYRNPQEIGIKFGATDLQEWFRTAAPNIPLGKDSKLKLDVNKPDTAEVVGMIYKKLDIIGQN